MAIKKVDTIWFDGELVKWDDATDHVLAHTLHYGVGAFEGIRSYKGAGGSAVFRLREHIDRLLESCHIATIECPYTPEQLTEACLQTLRANKLEEAYLRPVVYLGYGGLGLGSVDSPSRTFVAAWQWGAYLGAEGLSKGIRCKVSGFRRGAIDSFLSKGKITGQYVTSVLAKRDAIKNGFDEAIMLDQEGRVCEGTGENIFLVKQGVICTPPRSAAILSGITRETVIELARERGYEVIERSFTVDEMYTADELFFTGTAAEVTPVREVDHRTIGSGARGPITEKLQTSYFAAVRGEDPKRGEWLTRV